MMKCFYRLLIFFCWFITIIETHATNCHATLTIRQKETREENQAYDGTMVNPTDELYLTNNPSRIDINEGFSIIFEQCNDYCQARASNCYGYITGNWIDISTDKKPFHIFDKLNTQWENLSDHQEADCICLEKENVNNEIDEQYNNLKYKIHTNEHSNIFYKLQSIVIFWNSLFLNYHTINTK